MESKLCLKTTDGWLDGHEKNRKMVGWIKN